MGGGRGGKKPPMVTVIFGVSAKYDGLLMVQIFLN
jgi:hypothetical protein